MTDISDKKTFEEDFITKENSDDDEKFIRKDAPEDQKGKEEEKLEAVEKSPEVQSLIGKLKSFVFPKNNQQRNLARETGGLEAKEKKSVSSEDVWDNRSEEVDEMATDVFNSSGMKSVVWKKKKERLDQKEIAQDALEAASKSNKKRSPGQSQEGGYVSMLKQRQDQTTATNDHNQGGGFSR